MENQTRTEHDYIRNLYVYPNYAVLIPPPLRGERSKTTDRIENEKNLKQNRTKGVLSEKARKRLVNSINWLLLASKKKRIYCSKSAKWVNFRISFITLTVPVTNHGKTDEFFKRKVLHNFLSNAYSQYGLRNYVWKIERNHNGNIHFHLTTDSYIHHSGIRRLWNSALSTAGIIDLYQKKFENMNMDEYVELRAKEKDFNLKKVQNAYLNGVKENWRNPNSTDVHGVKNIRDLSAYLADYMGKKDEGKEPINGRLWGCSHSLSTRTKNETEMILTVDQHLEKDLFSDHVDIREIESKNEKTGVIRKVGLLFFWKLSQVDREIKYGVRDIISEVVSRIRSKDLELNYS